MSAELDRTQVIDLLPLYALGALEPTEMQAITAYLQQHPDLQERLAAFDETILHLAQSAPATPLPSTARAQLLARVQADRAEAAPPTTAAHTHTNQVAEVATKLPTPYHHPLFGWRRRRTPPTSMAPRPMPGRHTVWATRFGWMAAAAMLLLALLLFNRIVFLNSQVAGLTAEIANLREQNQRLETQWRTSRNQLALFLNADRSVALAGTKLAPTAQGAFYLNNAAGVVVVNGLDPLPADRTYQLWLVPPDGVPTSVALLPVDAGDLYTQTVAVPPTLSNFAIVDVSIEPAGGSPAITKETIVLRGVIN